MKNIFKYVYVILFFCLITPGTTGAVTITSGSGFNKLTQEQLDELNNAPSIEVSDFLINKKEYKAGENVYGSFVVKNDRGYLLSNLKYTVSLVGGYDENNIAYTYYDTKSFGPENLSASGTREIGFTYALPVMQEKSDGYGIKLKVFTSGGNLLGWADQKISILSGPVLVSLSKSESSELDLKDSYITVDKNKFGLQEGPTIKTGETGSLVVVVNNPSSEVVKNTPEIKIYNRTVSGDLLKTFVFDEVKFLSKKDNEIKLKFDDLIKKPGVYEGVVSFKDISGAKILPDVSFRYIVFGNIVTIQGVTLDNYGFKKGDLVNMKVNYSGSTFDITSGEVYKQSPMNTKINLTDSKGNIFSSYEGKIDYSNGTSIKIPLKILSSADFINVQVSVYDYDL